MACRSSLQMIIDHEGSMPLIRRVVTSWSSGMRRIFWFCAYAQLSDAQPWWARIDLAISSRAGDSAFSRRFAWTAGATFQAPALCRLTASCVPACTTKARLTICSGLGLVIAAFSLLLSSSPIGMGSAANG
ncbi:hypothetical protein AHiyo1_50230 [Arthrobacter sp. Hiyo1]|nr:hypothetical protein AHiyo1_50230 [Arthrobacter sp. Hiyo1]